MAIQAKTLVVFNRWATFAWIALAFPTLIWWKESILWVALMSIWANVASHFAAWIAARSERAQQQGHNLTEADRKWIVLQLNLSKANFDPDDTVELRYRDS